MNQSPFLLRSHPSFFTVYFLRQDIDPLKRSLSLLEGFNRIYGPSLIPQYRFGSGCLCFSMLFDRATFFRGAPNYSS